MPAISSQIYGASAASSTSSIYGTAPLRQGQSQAQQSSTGASYSVQLSQAGMQAQNSQVRKESVAPELLNALENDVSRTSEEMSRAIFDNRLHIQGLLSDDATSTFNFFGVSMPLAEIGTEAASPSAEPAASTTTDTSASAPSQAPRNAENNTNNTPQASSETNSETQPPTNTNVSTAEKTVNHDTEVARNAQENVTKHFDNFSAQLSGMAMAATASPAKAATIQ